MQGVWLPIQRDRLLADERLLLRGLARGARLRRDAMRGVYQFVPMQDFSHPWTDEMLYKKYDLDKNEIAFIESMIRPME